MIATMRSSMDWKIVQLSRLAYLLIAAACVGMFLREPISTSIIDTRMTYVEAVALGIGGVVGIVASFTGRKWLESVASGFAVFGSVIIFVQAMLLDIIPSWPPLERPVLSITATAFMALFFVSNLVYLSGEEPYADEKGPMLPDTKAIIEANELRGLSDDTGT